jgi:uncharacterized membrane protein YczE
MPSRSYRSLAARLAQLYAGLLLFGISVALMVVSGLGLSPWDVLHQGLARQTHLPLGTVLIIVSILVLLLWIPLRQRPGFGTLSNALCIGLVVNAILPWLPVPTGVLARFGILIAGILLNSIATALYIGAGLGPGPRDGLMTGLHRRTGRSLRLIRVCIELTAVAGGYALGGTVGAGTLAFALSIGPSVQFFVHRLGGTDTHSL